MKCGDNVAAEFDDLMKQMGVKPIKKNGGSVRKKTTPASTKRAVRAPQAPQIARTEALERTLAVAKEERAGAEAKITTLKKRVRRLKAENTALQEALAEPAKSVAETLVDWGFVTAEERADLLAQSGWLERIISHPSLADDHGLRTEIEETMVRVCGSCTPPSGKQSILVPAERCVVCGGVDLASATRTFVDSALLQGRLRIVIVGRTMVEHRAVRRQIGGDKRLVLTQLPGDIRRDIASAQTDVDHADAVVVWDEDSVSEDLLAVYRSSVRYGAVAAGPLGIFLEEAAKIISGD